VIREAARVIKNGGRIIVGIVDKKSFLGKYYKAKKSLFYENARFFSVNEVLDLLNKAGFKSAAFYQTLSKFPRNLTSIENPKKGFGKCGFVVISAVK
jgi:ubiquinone/menaquinone biosynthesis C-methylase UbiE